MITEICLGHDGNLRMAYKDKLLLSIFIFLLVSMREDKFIYSVGKTTP